jgi:formylglycine-generating enzyme required for sulfatase activity
VIERKSFEPETVYIPAGEFVMGSEGEGMPGYEGPKHTVHLPAYRIGKYPVTNEQYAAFLKDCKKRDVPRGAGWFQRKPPANREKHPVTRVSWYDALAYCEWLSKKTKRDYTLLSEAEWEKAARGPEGQVYPWSDKWEDGSCNHGSNDTTPVMDKTGNPYHEQGRSPYGCYDMLGNVQEWTRTIWGTDFKEDSYSYPYPDSHEVEADGREKLDPDINWPNLYRVHRGGSFRDDQAQLRGSARNRELAESATTDLGFRVALRVMQGEN